VLTNHLISKLSSAPPSELQPVTGKWGEFCSSGYNYLNGIYWYEKDDFMSPVSHAEALVSHIIRITTVLSVTEYVKGKGLHKINMCGNYGCSFNF
jgi:hypothetical protein